MVSIYDIVYDYIELFFTNQKLNKDQKKTIHQEVVKLLQNGWCSSDLYRAFKQYKGEQTLYVTKVMGNKKPVRKNLLKKGVFYYHNDLRLTSAPPKREVDYDSGEVKVINEPYFLEMKASYSIDDLIAYYTKQFGASSKHDIARYKGSFNWLLNNYKLETILFMIDITANMTQSEDMPPPSSPLDIQKYYRDALQTRMEKKTETIVAGGNYIVRKKRTRSGRNRR